MDGNGTNVCKNLLTHLIPPIKYYMYSDSFFSLDAVWFYTTDKQLCRTYHQSKSVHKWGCKSYGIEMQYRTTHTWFQFPDFSCHIRSTASSYSRQRYGSDTRSYKTQTSLRPVLLIRCAGCGLRNMINRLRFS